MTKCVAMFRGLGHDARVRLLFNDFFKKGGWVAAAVLAVFLLLAGPISHYLHLGSKTPVLLIGLFIFFSFLMPVTLGLLQGLERFFFLSFNGSVGALAKLVLAAGFGYLGLLVDVGL